MSRITQRLTSARRNAEHDGQARDYTHDDPERRRRAHTSHPPPDECQSAGNQPGPVGTAVVEEGETQDREHADGEDSHRRSHVFLECYPLVGLCRPLARHSNHAVATSAQCAPLVVKLRRCEHQ